jgi:hypothetical protein
MTGFRRVPQIGPVRRGSARKSCFLAFGVELSPSVRCRRCSAEASRIRNGRQGIFGRAVALGRAPEVLERPSCVRPANRGHGSSCPSGHSRSSCLLWFGSMSCPRSGAQFCSRRKVKTRRPPLRLTATASWDRYPAQRGSRRGHHLGAPARGEGGLHHFSPSSTYRLSTVRWQV